jgi:hypothetical protein
MYKLNIGHPYTRKEIANIVGDEKISISREGIYYLDNSVLLFVTLDKSNISKVDLAYNDFFTEDLFHWDSQNKQHINTPRIKEFVDGVKDVFLFARVEQKTKSSTNPFIYCGQLQYLSHDPQTKNPVHIIFQSIEYQDSPNHQLSQIYDWKPDGNRVSTAKPPTPEVIKKSIQKRKQNGQGYIKDSRIKKAVELRAMELASAYYKKLGYEVTDVSSTESVDLLCTKNEETRYIEVKGTQGEGNEVLLTANEIKRAKSGLYITDLFIVHSIQILNKNESIQAINGISLIIDKWKPEDTDLTPTHYRYIVPKISS